MSDRANVFLVAAASALAGAKLQDIVKALLERRRGSVSRPDASSGRPSTSRAAIAGTLVTPTKPKHEPPRTRTSIGSPDQKGAPENSVSKTPNAREDSSCVLCLRCGDEAPSGSRALTNGIHAERKMSLHTPARKPDPYLATGRSTYLTWDDYFMSVAFLSAQRSKDPNKQVGAVIVGPGKIICGVGYNGFPRGCGDNELPWAKKSRDNDPMDTKYAYVCHAEMNAIMNKNAQNLDGASLYVTMYPCNECAKLVIQSGIKEVVYFEGKDVPGDDTHVPGDAPKTKKRHPVIATPTRGGTRPDPTYAAAGKLLALADVRIRQHTPSATVDVTYE
jgi:dCMP deaminase